MEDKKYIQGHFFALATIFLWGTTFISTKILLRQFQPIEILFFRFLLGADSYLSKEAEDRRLEGREIFYGRRSVRYHTVLFI